MRSIQIERNLLNEVKMKWNFGLAGVRQRCNYNELRSQIISHINWFIITTFDFFCRSEENRWRGSMNYCNYSIIQIKSNWWKLILRRKRKPQFPVKRFQSEFHGRNISELIWIGSGWLRPAENLHHEIVDLVDVPLSPIDSVSDFLGENVSIFNYCCCCCCCCCLFLQLVCIFQSVGQIAISIAISTNWLS